MEGRIGRRDRRPAEAARRLLRLEPRALHARRGAVEGGREGVRAAASRGLIYKDKRLVNWDPKFQTAISDLEVVQVECKGAFKWTRDEGEPFDEAGACARRWRRTRTAISIISTIRVVDESGEETGEVLTVATTRPETMLGDTGVAVHPEDERYSALVGQACAPAAGRAADRDRRRRIFRSGKGHRRGQDHAGARLQRFRGRQAPRSRRRCVRSTCWTRRLACRSKAISPSSRGSRADNDARAPARGGRRRRPIRGARSASWR